MAVRRSAPQLSRANLARPETSDFQVKVPQWNLDMSWSLAPWPVIIRLGGTDIEVPAMPASEWLSFLLAENFTFGSLLDLIPEVDEVFMTEDVEFEDLGELITEMITTVSSRQWWITLRLLGVAKKHWDSIGPEMITSVNASEVSLAAWMTVLQATLIRHMDPKTVPMFIAQVQAPPPGTQAPEFQRQDLSRREFLAIAG